MKSGLCLVAITIGLVWVGNAPAIPKADVRTHACETALAQARERERALTPRRVAALLDLRYGDSELYLGYHLRAGDLQEAMQAVLEAGAEVVILRIEGGLGRMDEAAQVMHMLEEYEHVCEVIVWVSGWLGGAPGVAVAGVDEMCFTSEAGFGPLWYFPNALVNYTEPPDRTKVAPLVLEAARLSGRSEIVYRALGTSLSLSYDRDTETGAVTPRFSPDGEFHLHEKGVWFRMTPLTACVLGFGPCCIATYEELLQAYRLDDTGLGDEPTARLQQVYQLRHNLVERFDQALAVFTVDYGACAAGRRQPTNEEQARMEAQLAEMRHLLAQIGQDEPMEYPVRPMYDLASDYRYQLSRLQNLQRGP